MFFLFSFFRKCVTRKISFIIYLKASPLPPAPYVMAWGLPYVVQGLSFAAQGLHMAAQGLHLAAQGLHMGAQGLHMAA